MNKKIGLIGLLMILTGCSGASDAQYYGQFSEQAQSHAKGDRENEHATEGSIRMLVFFIP
jgi:hypothetical protein